MKIYLVLLLIFFSCNNNSYENDLGEIRKFEFTYEVHLSSSNERVEVWIPIPQNNEVQIISNEVFDYKDLYCEKLSESIHGNHYYYCYKDNLKNDVTLSYTCNVSRYEHGKINYKNLNSDNYDKGTNHITVPEGAMFSDILLDHNLNPDDIEAVYKYVLNGMHYGKPKNANESDIYYSGSNPKTDMKWLPINQEYGLKKVSLDEVVKLYQDSKITGSNYTFAQGNAVYACDIGVGNCTDYHSYFMSLLRTMDVPARFHMGFNIPNGESGKVGGYHCWADYYVEGQGWFPVDISEADKAPEKSEYFFGTINKDRVEFTTGRDLQLKNYDEEVNFFIYPLVKGTVHTKNFRYKDI